MVERAYVAAAHRSWAQHALTCTKGAGMRGIVHDRIVDVIMVLLENAGFFGDREMRIDFNLGQDAGCKTKCETGWRAISRQLTYTTGARWSLGNIGCSG